MKKVVAVTRIKFGQSEDEIIEANADVDVNKFTKKQLADLHDAGAIVIVDTTSVDEVKSEDVAPGPGVPATPVVPLVTPVKAEDDKK